MYALSGQSGVLQIKQACAARECDEREHVAARVVVARGGTRGGLTY